MADRLRILVLCSKMPYPPKDGGTMAMLSMIKGFAKAGHEVTVFTMNTPKHYVNLRLLSKEARQWATYHAIDVDTDVKLIDALANLLFSRQSYHVQRFSSKAFRTALSDHLDKEQYDIVQLETLFMAPYVDLVRQKAPQALISYRAHNVEHEIWRRRASNEKNPIKQVVLETTGLRILTYEEQTITRNPFDVVVPITGRDAGTLTKMGLQCPHYVCPAGIDFDDLPPPPTSLTWPSLFYLGALDWEPNREGLRWFLKEVWPRLSRKFPELQFDIAGRRMPKEFRAISKKNVNVLGEVDSAEAYLRPRAVMVVPILSGSGMRVKILEGMAHGKAIVATTMAAEGMGANHGEHLFLADDPVSYADCIATLLENRSLYNLMSDNARNFARARFSNDQVVGGLLNFYGEHLKRAATAQEESEA